MKVNWSLESVWDSRVVGKDHLLHGQGRQA